MVVVVMMVVMVLVIERATPPVRRWHHGDACKSCMVGADVGRHGEADRTSQMDGVQTTPPKKPPKNTNTNTTTNTTQTATQTQTQTPPQTPHTPPRTAKYALVRTDVERGECGLKRRGFGIASISQHNKSIECDYKNMYYACLVLPYMLGTPPCMRSNIAPPRVRDLHAN